MQKSRAVFIIILYLCVKKLNLPFCVTIDAKAQSHYESDKELTTTFLYHYGYLYKELD